MKQLKFDITINAPREKVWDILWSDSTYAQWTAPFAEGSRAETDWKEGSKVLFLGPDGNGMVSRIKEKRENEIMSFEHLGVVKDGIEDTISKEVEGWKGALETYSLKEKGNKTELTVEMDIMEDYLEEFEKVFPKALSLVKNLSE